MGLRGQKVPNEGGNKLLSVLLYGLGINSNWVF